MIARLLAITFIAALVLSTHSSSRADTLDAPNAKNSLRPGAWALQFQIIDEDLIAFQGGSFSGKRHYSAASAIRLGVGINTAISESDFEDVPYYIRNEDREDASLDATIQYAYYFAPETGITPYLFLGPRGTFVWRKLEVSEADLILASERADQIKDKAWGVGVSGGLGVEWFPHGRISLLGEYRSAFMFSRQTNTQWSRSTSGSTTTRTSELDRFSVTYDSVRLGLSLYF